MAAKAPRSVRLRASAAKNRATAEKLAALGRHNSAARALKAATNQEAHAMALESGQPWRGSVEAQEPPSATPLAVPSSLLDPLGAESNLAASLTGIEVPSWLLPTTVAVAGAGAVAGAVAYGASRSKKRKRSSSSKRRAGTSRRRRVGKGGVVRGKKDRNRRGGAVRDSYKGRKVYRTKRGQPYILMANGKARFVRA